MIEIGIAPMLYYIIGFRKKKYYFMIPFHIFNLVSRLLPARCHRIRASLLRKCGCVIGKNVRINAAVRIYSPYVEIGHDTWIGPEVVFLTGIQGKVTIGERCDIGPGVCFITGSHHIGSPLRRAGDGYCKPIFVENGCWIGAKSTILGGAIIDGSSIVAAGAVVLPGKYPKHAVLAGVPAKTIKTLPLDNT